MSVYAWCALEVWGSAPHKSSLPSAGASNKASSLPSCEGRAEYVEDIASEKASVQRKIVCVGLARENLSQRFEQQRRNVPSTCLVRTMKTLLPSELQHAGRMTWSSARRGGSG
eukprot:351929-Chlamydomonas_euryale.AAC.6